MIDISYVNGSDSYFNIKDEYSRNIATIESYQNFIDEQYDRLRIIQEKSELNRSIMEPYYSEQGINYDGGDAILEASEGIFAKIGNAVIGVIKFIIGLFDKFIDWIKSFSFRNKDAMTKAEMMMKRHPDIKEEKLKVAISKGYIDFNSMKYFADLDKAYEKAKKQITAKNKNAVVKGFDKATDALLPDSKLVGVAKGAGAVAGVAVTFYGGYKWLQSRPEEHERAFTKERAKLSKELDEAVRYANTIRSANNTAGTKDSDKKKNNREAQLAAIRGMDDQQVIEALDLIKKKRYNDAIRIVEASATAIGHAVDAKVSPGDESIKSQVSMRISSGNSGSSGKGKKK